MLCLKSSRKGILFLPNHPAEIDPVLLMTVIGPHFYPRALVVEHFYRLKGFKWLLDLARVMPIPSMAEKANKWRGKEIEKKQQEVMQGLDRGENFIIYPSGKLKLTGLELLGGGFIYAPLAPKQDRFNRSFSPHDWFMG